MFVTEQSMYCSQLNNMKQPVPLQDVNAWPEGKRETGGRPVRSRHCMRNGDVMWKRSHWAIGKATLLRAASQETCRLLGTGKNFSRSRGLDCTVAPFWACLFSLGGEGSFLACTILCAVELFWVLLLHGKRFFFFVPWNCWCKFFLHTSGDGSRP